MKIIFKLFFILIFIVFPGFIFGFDIPVYPVEKTAVIKTGKQDKELRFSRAMGDGGGNPGPTHYVFSPEGDFYACDYLNGKIKVFDSEFNFKKVLNTGKKLNHKLITCIRFDSSDSFVAMLEFEGLYNISNAGEVALSIPYNKLSEEVYKDNGFFLIDGFLLYHSGSRKGGYILADKKGVLLSGDKRSTIIDGYRNKFKKKFKLKKGHTIQEITAFLEEKKIFFTDEQIFTADISIYRDYFEVLKNSVKSPEISDVKTPLIFDHIRTSGLRGFDKYNNSYWICINKKKALGLFVLILSQYGEILDYFKAKGLFGNWTVAPDGNIYINKINEESLTLYRVIRN